MMIDPNLAKKLASSAFILDRVYRYRHVRSRSKEMIEDGKGSLLAIVAAHAAGWCDVAFEFVMLKGGSKLKCVGMGRPEYAPSRFKRPISS